MPPAQSLQEETAPALTTLRATNDALALRFANSVELVAYTIDNAAWHCGICMEAYAHNVAVCMHLICTTCERIGRLSDDEQSRIRRLVECIEETSKENLDTPKN